MHTIPYVYTPPLSTNVVDTQLGFEWRSTQEGSEVGSAARMRSTQRTSTVISLFSSGAYCVSLADCAENSTLTIHIVRFSFFLTKGTQAIFLEQTPTASEGALLCDFLPQLRGALHTSYSNEVPRLSVVIFQLERSKGRPLGQAVPSCLGAVSRSTL